MKIHTCHTSDGFALACFCSREADHDEAQFDVPIEEPQQGLDKD
jgi:hypothetical protein